MSLRLIRDTPPDAGFAFSIQPFGARPLGNGTIFDFDNFYESKLVPSFQALGLKLGRADQIYGQGDVAGTAWYGIQKAAVVIVDFTLSRPNVNAEFALAVALGKRIIVITQDPDDIPSDVQGHFRYVLYGPQYHEIDRLMEELAKEVPAALQQPSSEMFLVPMPGIGGTTTPVHGRVTHAEKDFVMVLTEDGRRVVLGPADVDYRRIVPDMAKRFPVGTSLQGSFEVDLNGGTRYTLLAGQTNPWPSLERQYPVGTRIQGTVDRVIPGTGVFVHIGLGINGLIPEKKTSSRAVTEGEKVDVEVVSMDTANRRVALLFANMPKKLVAMPSGPAAKVGDVFDSEVVKVQPEGKGGFLLVLPDGWARPAMLHCTAMSAELRQDLNSGLVQPGDLLHVEVISATGGKVCTKDRPDLDDDDRQAA